MIHPARFAAPGGDELLTLRGTIILALYFPDIGHVGDESVPFPLHGLHEPRVLGIIPENLAYLANRRIDAVFRVYEDSLAPEPFFYLLPADESTVRRHQQHQ